MGQDIDIHGVWKVEQEILDVIHAFCVKYHLKYSIAYGTLLGAVRHKGFIPWDDDIDIIMPRKDYEKFRKLWHKSGPKGYLIEDYDDDVHITNNFIKIMKEHTTFLMGKYEQHSAGHHGIFVDVFPMDKVPEGKISRLMQFCASCVELLYFRGYTSGHGGMMGVAEKLLLSTKKSNYVKRRRKASALKQKWNKSPEKLKLMNAATFEECRFYYAANLFDQLDLIEFNGKKYFATHEWKAFLVTMYGDYMKLPPEEERVWKHRPVLVDYEHDYRELGIKMKNKNMEA